MGILRVLGDLPGLKNIPQKDWSSASAITVFFEVAIAAAGLVAVAFIVINAIQMVTANGDIAKVKKARNGILYAIIGLLIVILAEAITFFVSSNVE